MFPGGEDILDRNELGCPEEVARSEMDFPGLVSPAASLLPQGLCLGSMAPCDNIPGYPQAKAPAGVSGSSLRFSSA